VKPNPAGEEWLEKLEAWLAANQHPDIIYVLAVGHRDGYTSMLANIGEKSAVDFLSTFIKQTTTAPIYSSVAKKE
jgi:hypothetical protein